MRHRTVEATRRDPRPRHRAIDRPLTRLADFDRFAGFDGKVEMAGAVDGQRRFSGRLCGTRGEDLVLDCDGDEVVLPFAEMVRAKLLLTDALIAASREPDAGETGADGN